MSCNLCRKFRKKYPLKNGRHKIQEGLFIGKIKCAFDRKDGLFSTHNWNCETMNALRDLIQDCGYQDRDDNRSASVGVLRIPESDRVSIQQGYLILSWYKDRGRTGRVYIIWDDKKVEILTLQTAEFIINAYEKREK